MSNNIRYFLQILNYLILVQDPVFSLNSAQSMRNADRSDLRFLRERIYRHALEYLLAVRAKDGGICFFAFLRLEKA